MTNHSELFLNLNQLLLILVEWYATSGLSPTNKKTQKNSLNSGKYFRLLKIPQILQIVGTIICEELINVME
jgi:hypothetical protein